MRGKCIYCKAKIDATNIRCYKCDVPWQDGHQAGEKKIRETIKEIVHHVKNLAGLND